MPSDDLFKHLFCTRPYEIPKRHALLSQRHYPVVTPSHGLASGVVLPFPNVTLRFVNLYIGKPVGAASMTVMAYEQLYLSLSLSDKALWVVRALLVRRDAAEAQPFRCAASFVTTTSVQARSSHVSSHPLAVEDAVVIW
jgi:hypothetical protein